MSFAARPAELNRLASSNQCRDLDWKRCMRHGDNIHWISAKRIYDACDLAETRAEIEAA
jgi:hypothetical protein